MTCTEASDAPQHHRFFAEGCLHCAARRIQFIQRRLNLAPDAIRTRCRTALEQALQIGMPEMEIRRMAKLAAWQLAEPAPAPEIPKPKRVR